MGSKQSELMRPCDFFRKLHSIPELSGKEYKTSDFIAEQLDRFGLEVIRHISDTSAVMGILRGRDQGPVLAMRADMDALPFADADGKPLVIHACGHDAHSSMLLAVAQRIVAEGGISAGEIRFIFQPEEETATGARKMLRSGVLDGVDGIVGIHLRPRQEAGLHEATPELHHGATAILRAVIHGENAHASQPNLGINAIDGAAFAVQAVNAIHLNPQIPSSAKVTGIHSAGAAVNIIPDTVHLDLDLRTQDNQSMSVLIKKVEAAIASGAACVNAGAEVKIRFITAAAEPDPWMTALAARSMKDVVAHTIPCICTSGGEDFHFYSSEGHIPSAFIGLGCGMTGGLHKPDMTFDIDALEDGAQILYNFARGFLAEKSCKRATDSSSLL